MDLKSILSTSRAHPYLRYARVALTVRAPLQRRLGGKVHGTLAVPLHLVGSQNVQFLGQRRLQLAACDLLRDVPYEQRGFRGPMQRIQRKKRQLE